MGSTADGREAGIRSGAVKSYYGTSDNAGAGLFYTRRLAATARGQFALISGDAFLYAHR